jgi:hypothetical protein
MTENDFDQLAQYKQRRENERQRQRELDRIHVIAEQARRLPIEAVNGDRDRYRLLTMIMALTET